MWTLKKLRRTRVVWAYHVHYIEFWGVWEVKFSSLSSFDGYGELNLFFAYFLWWWLFLRIFALGIFFLSKIKKQVFAKIHWGSIYLTSLLRASICVIKTRLYTDSKIASRILSSFLWIMILRCSVFTCIST